MGSAVTAFLGGAATVILGVLLSYLDWWPVPEKYTTIVGLLAMVGSAFWAYHKQRIKHLDSTSSLEKAIAGLNSRLTTAKPEIGVPFVLLNCRLRKINRQESDVIRWEIHNIDAKPDHILEVLLGVEESIPASTIVVECDGPIYDLSVYWKLPDDEPLLSADHKHDLPEVVTVATRKPLPAKTYFSLQLYVEPPIHLRRVTLRRTQDGSRHSAAPRSPKSS